MNKSPMLIQIQSVPNLMSELLPQLRQKAAKLVQNENLRNAQKIIIVGCGDSYCAAMAAKQIFCEITNKEIEVATAIEVARIYSKTVLVEKTDTAYIFVSNSGTVSRILEAAKRIKQFSGYSIAVTGSQKSPLFAIADSAITMEVPKLCGGPGMRSYTASIMSLYAIAIELSLVLKQPTANYAETIWENLLKLPQQLETMLPKWDKQAVELAEKLKNSTSYEFIGCGTNYANSWFAYAKELEVVGRAASAINTEDWLHMNYFIKDVHETATFLYIDKNCPSYSRAKELQKVAAEMERPLIVITNESDVAPNAAVISLPNTYDSLLNAFVGYLPVSMIMGYLGIYLGEEDFRGTKDYWTACINFATVAASEQIIFE